MYKTIPIVSALLALGFASSLMAESVEECTPKVFVIPLPYKKGSAVAEDVMDGKTFTNKDAVNIPGTMVNNGALAFTPGTTRQTIPEGYHDGSGSVTGDSSLTATNIKSGATIFNIAGTAIESSGTATAVEVLSGRTFSNDSGAVDGAMVNNGAFTFTPGTTRQTIPEGYHNGSGSVTGDSDLTTDNIRAGSEIFGIDGSRYVIDTYLDLSVAAHQERVLEGMTCYARGREIIGVMPRRVVFSPITPGTQDVTLEHGYWQNNLIIKGAFHLLPENIEHRTDIFGINGTFVGLCDHLAELNTACESKCGELFSVPEYTACVVACQAYGQLSGDWCNENP